MEMIDTDPLVEATWDGLVDLYNRDGLSNEVLAFVGNVAEGYPFPTNLDRRVPEAAGMAPASEQTLLVKGLQNGWTKEKALSELRKIKDESRA